MGRDPAAPPAARSVRFRGGAAAEAGGDRPAASPASAIFRYARGAGPQAAGAWPAPAWMATFDSCETVSWFVQYYHFDGRGPQVANAWPAYPRIFRS